MNNLIFHILLVNCSGSIDKSAVTKLEGNSPSPFWLLPFHQFGSESSNMLTKIQLITIISSLHNKFIIVTSF